MAAERFHTLLRHVVQSKNVAASTPAFLACARQQHQMKTLPNITAEPRVALHDDKVKITLKDFPCNEKITLHGEFIQGQKKEDKSVVFASCGQYMTNKFGQVNIWEQPSTGGTYTGIEPMGIVWSLQSAPDNPRFVRMATSSTERPSVIHLKSYLGHLRLEDIYQSSSELTSLADIWLERWFKSPDVTRVEVHAGNVRGVLYLPPGEGPFQGVIDMFGSSGGLIEYRAALLASRGFAALSLSFYRYKDLPKSLDKVTLDYFEEAVNWFSTHRKVFPHGIGVLSLSKAVEYAYCMSAYFEKVKSVVAINGHPFVGIFDLPYKGKILHTSALFKVSEMKMTEEGALLSDCMPEKSEIIPAWKGNAKHLILVSEDDFQLEVDAYKSLLEACPEEKKCNFEVVRYPGAGHLLEPPYTALCRSTVNPAFNLLMVFGGQMKEHAHAQEDAWQRILNHLRKTIPTN